MLVQGCDSGCAPSTNCDGRQPRSSRKPPFMTSLVWSGLLRGPATFRGRHRDPFSESRMREMSGNRKQSHAKPDCGGAAKASPHATGRLPLLRLFSTLPKILAVRGHSAGELLFLARNWSHRGKFDLAASSLLMVLMRLEVWQTEAPHVRRQRSVRLNSQAALLYASEPCCFTILL
jgi:hypothetical protein